MSILITGGAGFIGSCVLKKFNDAGLFDIIIVDNIASSQKWKNIQCKKFIDYIHKEHLMNILYQIYNVEAIIHLGAQSSTMETDFDYLWNNNFDYSKKLWIYCVEKRIPFIYASSAATYGNGSLGFSDENSIDMLRPLNAYGYSKHLFDSWVYSESHRTPPQYVGLKFFNVYGPNEYHKENMASMVFHGYKQIKSKSRINLFRSYSESFKNGDQCRDFIYVKDIADIILWFYNNPSISGLFNVGTGNPRTFNELANILFSILKVEPHINYIDIPDTIKRTYQYYTKADIAKLRKVGYRGELTTLEDGIYDYVSNYLEGSNFY